MQIVHELGHVLAALVSGGRVAAVVLNPLEFSRTDLAINLHPLFVAWSGAMVGSIVPVLAAAGWPRTRLPARPVVRFFAGFCLIANGAYLGAGSFVGAGDAGDLLRHGAAIWHLWLFGLATVPVGFWSWNGLGPSFGLGAGAGRVDIRMTRLTAVCACVVVLAVCALTWRSSLGAGRDQTDTRSTDTSSAGFATLAEKAAFLQEYVLFRRSYLQLDFDIEYHDNSSGSDAVPGPSDWDIRIVAVVPANELPAWTSGLTPVTVVDTKWLVGVTGSINLDGVDQWFQKAGVVVGVDEINAVVVYRNATN